MSSTEKNLIVCLDSDSESMGIVRTSLPVKEVEVLWKKYYSFNSDIDVNDFIEQELTPLDPDAIRYFLEEVSPD